MIWFDFRKDSQDLKEMRSCILNTPEQETSVSQQIANTPCTTDSSSHIASSQHSLDTNWFVLISSIKDFYMSYFLTKTEKMVDEVFGL